MDCPDTCSLSVTVENDRIVKVRGSDALPYTGGVSATRSRTRASTSCTAQSRLHYPLRRIGPRGSGRFERIGWAEALDRIHGSVMAVIDRWAPQAVMPFNYGARTA